MTPSIALNTLQGFIGIGQLRVMVTGCRGEEGQFFRDKLSEYGERVSTMPQTYAQDALGQNAVAHLHYFTGSCDWYITERDVDTDGEGQIQAFGSADLGYGPELGYINIAEIIKAGAELDLHFTPCALASLRQAA
jgi:hypothetical protein